MSWRTNPALVRLRRISRAIGLNSWVSAHLRRAGDERMYADALCQELRSGDTVWDVGANLGQYSLRFASLVGSRGTVYAFEPSPRNRVGLVKVCTTKGNVLARPEALAEADGKVLLMQGEDEFGATSRIVEFGSGGTVVEARSGRSLIETGRVMAPNALKIDVEGYEREVLSGFGEHLAAEGLRVIGVEVHFSILESRGFRDAPRDIEELLQKSGFMVRWCDASHIVAVR